MKTLILLFCLPLTVFSQEFQAKSTPAPDVKAVESAALTPEESKEGQDLLIKQANKLNQRGQLAQKIIDAGEGSAEVLLLAYRERDRVLVEMQELEGKSQKFIARVQQRTGCTNCVYFDFEKNQILLKSLPLEKK